ncbi:hypothetical protein AAG747_11405 [Rapidithrix thailandica]|uniref:Uncharacterized protein n=1 Tax=Rapidithrix thailandica TaxID=413964 RepID=A0AAW9S7T3_9BACT
MKFCKFGLTLKVTMLFFLFSSCEEEINWVEPPAPRTNRILEYKITNVTGEPILGAIDDVKNTITVYLPFHNFLTVLVPEIKIPEGAQVSPEGGAPVENLLAYFTEGREINYTVTDKEGNKATYQLHILVQQPGFSVEELSPDPESPRVYSFIQYTEEMNIFLEPLEIHWKGNVPQVENYETNYRVIKVTLQKENGYSYTFDFTGKQKPDITSSRISQYFPVTPGALPEGQYTVSVQYYSQVVTMKNPVIIQQQPS